MNNKKRIVNLEYFREMLHICLRILNQTFDELLFKEEFLAFLRYLGHSGEIKKITDLWSLIQVDYGLEKRNFRLRSDITSKESTLQVVYDVLILTPFYKAFLVTSDVTEIYMQEFWATTTVHHHSIRFKMNNKKRIVNLKYFKEMLHICPRTPNQTFDELLFEEEILAFLRYLGHSREIKKITDVNINKLHQPWRSFSALINKCLSGKIIGYDSLRNSVAYKEYAIALGAAPPKTKASLRKTQSISDTIMSPPTNAGTRISTSEKGKQPANSSKAKGLYVLYEVALTKAEEIKLATKRSLQQTHISQSSRFGVDEGTGIIPGVLDVPTDESDKKISWKSSDEDDDVDDQSDTDDDDDDDDQEDEYEEDDDDQDDNDDYQDLDNDDDDFVHPKLSTHVEETKDEERFDPIVQTLSQVENSDDESHGMNVGGDKGSDAEDDDEELYRDLNINQEGCDVQLTDVHTTQVLEDTHVILTSVNPDGQQQSSSLSSQFVTSMFNPSPKAGIDSLFELTPWVDVLVMTTVMPFLVTAPTLPPPSIPIISQRMNEAVKVAVQIQSDRLRNEAQRENYEFLKTIEENMKKIIKEQVKEQVKVQVSKITKIKQTVNEQLEAEVLTRSSHSLKTSYAVDADLLEMELKKILIEKIEANKAVSSILGIVQRYMDQRMNEAVKIEKTVNEQLEAEVLTRLSNSSKTAYVVTADLSELELKKILIEKMKGNKSIHRSDEKRNLYKALVESYESDKIIFDTYRDTVTLKRRRDDDADKDEEPFAGSDRGSKKRREGKEPESTSASKEKATRKTGKST
nr:hypothetical protein [Tanacetum cinerariifolium]